MQPDNKPPIEFSLLTMEQVELLRSVLTEKVVSLKGKAGTEITQARLCEIIKFLDPK